MAKSVKFGNGYYNRDGWNGPFSEGGHLHRENEPARTFASGLQQWWIHGKLHRTDGPAWVNGNEKRWFLDGIEYTNIA